MKGLAAALACIGLGLLAGEALADSPPVPTVPSITVPVPPVPVPTSRDSGGVLGSATVEKTARAIRTALIALLVAAILLLGLASLPQVALADARVNEALARHRTQIAGVGAAAFVAVLITFLLG